MATAESAKKANYNREQNRLEEQLFKQGMDSGIYQDDEGVYKQLSPEDLSKVRGKDNFPGINDMEENPMPEMDEAPKDRRQHVGKYDDAKRKASEKIGPHFSGMFWLKSIDPRLDLEPFSKSIINKKIGEDA